MGAPIPVTVVTGFLGSGKTTLVNRWLADFAPGEVAVIVNEQGAVGIDGALFSSAASPRTIVEIPGGCVCCTTQADLVRALDGLATATPPPKRILVETSGAASPAGVLHAIRGSARIGAHALDGVVTVIDTTRATATLAEHELAVEQVGYADVVVLSRADLADADARARAEGAVARHNGAAVIVSAARGELEGSASLASLLARRDHDLVPAAPAPTRHVYESVSLSHEGNVDGDRFADFVETEVGRFAGRLFRTKGILAVEGLAERMIVQGVADEVEITFGAAWGDTPRSSRFVVVGFGLDREALLRAFDACKVLVSSSPCRAT